MLPKLTRNFLQYEYKYYSITELSIYNKANTAFGARDFSSKWLFK